MGVTYQLMLVLLGDVVEVEVCDGVVAPVNEAQEKVRGAIEVDPLLLVRIVGGHREWRDGVLL